MYKMPEFTERDHEEVLAFMKAHPFVTLIGTGGQQSVATQVPVLITEAEGKILLQGHIMRKTDHHLAFIKNAQALVLFTGPHCYVSASWYSERGHGSTWNYMTVHAHGNLRFMDEEATLELIRNLTHKYEDTQQRPELLEKVNQEAYVRPMLRAIAGFELWVESLHPIFKLSQNQDSASYSNIIEQLIATGDCDSKKIAAEMAKRAVNFIPGS